MTFGFFLAVLGVCTNLNLRFAAVRSVGLVLTETTVSVAYNPCSLPAFVAYYRVSTERQGASGLGLEAQRAAVARFAGSASLLAEFTEVESGKRHTSRPQLLAAIELCQQQKATLVIAKLDRLARNAHFIAGLLEAGVEFVAADMPQANRLTIHVLAAIAEHEREAISQRTRSALQAAKARGWVIRAGRNPSRKHAKRRI
jgi:DNA invertase Pin-like site-specific DNA recombinase